MSAKLGATRPEINNINSNGKGVGGRAFVKAIMTVIETAESVDLFSEMEMKLFPGVREAGKVVGIIAWP